MTEIKLNAQIRSEKDKKAKQVRTDGFIPAVIYGSGVKTRNLKVNQLDFERVFAQAGESNLIDLTVDQGKPVKIIVKDTQRDRIKNNIIHVDFYQVDMKKKITTEIPLNFIGVSKAKAELDGTLVKNLDSIEVECLPADLVDHIDVDLTSLENLGDIIRIENLNIPSSITATSELDEVVVSVIEPREEIEEEEVKEEAEEEAEGVKAEGEEVEEGKAEKEVSPQGEAEKEEIKQGKEKNK